MKSPFFWSAISVSILDQSAIIELPKAVKNASSLCFERILVGSIDQAKQALRQQERPASQRGTKSSCWTPGKCLAKNLALDFVF
jgi:hypothetical protein